MNNKIITKITSSLLLGTMLVYTTPVLAFTKDETVYSKQDSTGKTYNTIINNHIHNVDQAKFINDLSDLLNIKNVNGDETFELNGNTLVWNANGNDIYYQGESQKELPVNCKIKYELDGNEVSANDIVGKSGIVKITLEYTNNDVHTVNINGRNETLYTPFLVICGTIINNENNKNITVSNGKIVNDGTKTALLGFAVPGLQESLNLSKDTINLPSSVEITMEAKDFELNNIITFITPKVLDDEDFDVLNEFNDLLEQVDTLQSSSHQLVDGANTLSEGTTAYAEKSSEFNDAISQITGGINSASSSYSQIDAGINSLAVGASTAQAGAQAVSEGSVALAGGISTVDAKLGEIELGLNTILNSIPASEIPPEVANLLNSNATMITILSNNQSLDAGTRQALITLLESNTTAITEILEQSATSQQMLSAGLNQLNDGIGALKAGTSELSTKSAELANGANAVAQGISQISTGAQTLNAGSTEMKKGLNKLNSSSNLVKSASNQLTSAAVVLSDGASTLATGMQTFNDEGIDKICNYINGNLRDVKTRVDKLKLLSNEYNTFTMKNDDDYGTVKFILVTDSLKIDTSSTDKKDDE